MGGTRKLLILDMDGVVVSSESTHSLIYERIREDCAQGQPVQTKSTVGVSSVQVYQTLLDACPPCAVTAQELSARHYREVWQELQSSGRAAAEPGLKELLAAAKALGIPYAVASCSPRWFVEKCLAAAGILENAVTVVAGDCGLPVKPEPDIYLEVLCRTGIAPEQALAVEDSRSGTLAAKRAGIPCAAYRNPDTGVQELSAAVWQVDELREIEEILRGLK